MDTIVSDSAPVRQVSTAPDPDWDAIIDSPYGAAPLNRVVRSGNWWVLTGMTVDLEEAINRAYDIGALAEGGRGVQDNLLIFVDTLTAKHVTDAPILCRVFQRIVVMARRLEANTQLLLEKRGWEVEFRFGFYVRAVSPATCVPKLTRWMKWQDPQKGERQLRGTTDLPDPRTPKWAYVTTYPIDESKPLPFTISAMDLAQLPLPACAPMLERMLFAAQSLAADGKGTLAVELLARLEELLALSPGLPAWQPVALGCRNAQELLRPVRMDPDQVPYLSASFYGELAKDHVPALTAYAGMFIRLTDRAYDLDARKRAAKLVLGEKEDAGAFQKLVGEQLAENFRLATANVKRAQDAIAPQSDRVQRAEKVFKDSMAAWKEAKEREATLAIVGAVFSFVSGVASMFAGNASGATSAAKAAADVASTAAKLAQIMSQLAKVGEVIEKIVRMCLEIVAAVDRIADAKSFADALAAITRDSLSDDAKGAPSAGAYWDQLWVEVKTQLAPAIKEGIGGAQEYLKELKILVIYGRALTTAQVALPPLIQEMARTALQKDIAKRQYDAIAREIESLQKEQMLSGQAMAVLWGNYRALQRSLLVALGQFDAAYRYWALTDTVTQRDNYRGIAELAGDLAAIADLKKMQARALESFKPQPQDYQREKFALPATVRAALLDGQHGSVRLSPTNSPLSAWGRTSRVRVREIYVWVEWAPGKRPTQGMIEFTIRTGGAYDDQRLVNNETKAFHFHGTPLDLTFRYDLAGTPADEPGGAVRVRAAIAEDFRTSYSEPTLYADWILSTPKASSGDATTVDLTRLKADITGIRLEFSGMYIKDPDRVV
ncbi:hypothetical protein [Lysobacter tyrosinilyticus]